MSDADHLGAEGLFYISIRWCCTLQLPAAVPQCIYLGFMLQIAFRLGHATAWAALTSTVAFTMQPHPAATLLIALEF